jgi:flagellar basal-body rod protein FlgC
MIGLFSGLNISASGMRATRIQQNCIASNLANAETTRTESGGPYRRQFVVLGSDSPQYDGQMMSRAPGLEATRTRTNHLPQESGWVRDSRFVGTGVKVAEIREDSRPPTLLYDPAHPDADENGYVAMPNVNVVKEMTDMISATRAYEANSTAFNATKTMLMQSIQM